MDSIDFPLVDIVVPAFNAEKYIKQTLESILQQTYENYNIYIINDGSTDNTNSVIQKFNSNNIFIVDQNNSGPSKSRNNGYRNGKGKYVVFLDSDDLWSPEFLERTVKFLEQHENIGYVFTEFSTFNTSGTIRERWSQEDGRVFEIPALNSADREKIFSRKIWSDLLVGSFVPMGGALLRRESVDDTGLFDESLTNAEDREFFIRLSYEYDSAFIDECLFHYRIHENSLSRNLEKLTIGSTLVGDRLMKTYNLNAGQRKNIRKNLSLQWQRLGKDYLRKNNTCLARKSLNKSLSYFPEVRSLIYLLLCITFLYKPLRWFKHRIDY